MGIGKHSMEIDEMGEEIKPMLGLHIITHGFERDIEETVTKVVEGSLRSGKKIEFQGTIVIIGDINAGAEVIAEENIIVLGTIRGLVHAGAKGNRKAKIYANSIEATQIRIADIVKEKEMPVIEEDIEEENRKDKKEKSKKQEELYEIDIDDDIKRVAYINNAEIILE